MDELRAVLREAREALRLMLPTFEDELEWRGDASPVHASDEGTDAESEVRAQRDGGHGGGEEEEEEGEDSEVEWEAGDAPVSAAVSVVGMDGENRRDGSHGPETDGEEGAQKKGGGPQTSARSASALTLEQVIAEAGLGSRAYRLDLEVRKGTRP